MGTFRNMFLNLENVQTSYFAIRGEFERDPDLVKIRGEFEDENPLGYAVRPGNFNAALQSISKIIKNNPRQLYGKQLDNEDDPEKRAALEAKLENADEKLLDEQGKAVPAHAGLNSEVQQNRIHIARLIKNGSSSTSPEEARKWEGKEESVKRTQTLFPEDANRSGKYMRTPIVRWTPKEGEFEKKRLERADSDASDASSVYQFVATAIGPP